MKVVAGIILAFLLGAMFVSLFQMSTDMDMTRGMSDCPYMSHEDTLCPMNLLDHLGVWKTVFVSVFPSFATLLLILVAVCVVAAPNLFLKRRQQRFRVPLVGYRFYDSRLIVRRLQELFSAGILHPKLFSA